MTSELPVFRYKTEPSTNAPKDWLQLIKVTKRQSNDYRTLLRLYHRAANLIVPEEHEKDPAYAQLLVEFAQLQSKTSAEDARDTFRVARCNVKRFAIVYISWAQLELSQGNKSKCRKLLQKGRQNNAKPEDILQIATANYEQGRERLLDEETEELALTGVQVLPNTTLQPQTTAAQSDNDTVEKRDDTESGVVSFKMPSIAEGVIGFRPRHSTSSSSGEDTVTAPFHHICKPTARGQTMSHQKPSVKPTPDGNKNVGSSSLAKSMNLSVRKPAARRGLGSSTVFLGLPKRAMSSLANVKEGQAMETDDDNGIQPIEHTIDITPRVENISQEKTVENKIDNEILQENNDGNKVFGNSLGNNQAQPDYQKPKTPEFADKSIDRQSTLAQNNHEQKLLENNLTGKAVEPVFAVPRTPQLDDKPVGSGHPPRGVVSQANKENICNIERKSTMDSEGELNNRVAKNGVFSNGDLQPRIPMGVSNGDLQPRIPMGVSKIEQNAPNVVYAGHHNIGWNQVKPNPTPSYPPATACVNPSMGPPGFPVHEAIVVNGKVYQKLEKMGRGGSSQVFRAFDGKHSCAVKQVSLEDADEVIVQSYINEITLLNQLQGCDHIIKLYNWELNKEQKSLTLVLECGSIDLSAFLRKNRSSLTPSDLNVYWKQMLQAVNVVHERGIVHSDLKPANFLFVDGQLKLIDFGIANAIQADQTSIHRDTQIGTLNFMAPEAFMDVSSYHMDQRSARKPCMKIGRASDVWSLGCILYNMVYGRTPFQHITNQAMKLQCIMDPSYTIEFPPIQNDNLLDVMKGCLKRDPRERYTIQQLLGHQFLTAGVQAAPPDQEQLYKCLMEFAQADVNSPRSVRQISQRICEQLRHGNRIDMSSVLPRPNRS